MASQIIEVSSHLFDSLLRSQASVRGELWQAGFDTPNLWRNAEPTCILFHADIDRYGLGYRPVLQDRVIVLAVVPSGEQPYVWPRPLPDDMTFQLLEILQPILESGEDLSAHERLELADAINVAREGPAIGAEPLSPLPTTTKRQRRLRALGSQLSHSLEPELADLDVRIGQYRQRVRQADLEKCIAALSSHAELGIQLRLRPGVDSGHSFMGLLTIGRRPSLEILMETVAGLSDATLYALARHAPHSSGHDLPIAVADLVHLQSTVTNSAHRPTRNPWRTYDKGYPGLARCGALDSPVPAVAVLNGVEQWVAACDRRRWVDLHPLIAAAILHVEFIRLSPFERANGRMARILFQAQLYEYGWPVLPWHFAFERFHDDYVAALETALRRRSHEPFLAFALKACAIAIAKGSEMVSALKTERDRLAEALTSNSCALTEHARDYAEALLSGVFWRVSRRNVSSGTTESC